MIVPVTCLTCRGRGYTVGRTVSGRINCADCLGTGLRPGHSAEDKT